MIETSNLYDVLRPRAYDVIPFQEVTHDTAHGSIQCEVSAAHQAKTQRGMCARRVLLRQAFFPNRIRYLR